MKRNAYTKKGTDTVQQYDQSEAVADDSNTALVAEETDGIDELLSVADTIAAGEVLVASDDTSLSGPTEDGEYPGEERRESAFSSPEEQPSAVEQETAATESNDPLPSVPDERVFSIPTANSQGAMPFLGCITHGGSIDRATFPIVICRSGIPFGMVVVADPSFLGAAVSKFLKENYGLDGDNEQITPMQMSPELRRVALQTVRGVKDARLNVVEAGHSLL